MKGLNLSQFKKIASDKKTSTLRHPDGHEIKIFHSALPAIQRKALERLPTHNEEKLGQKETSKKAVQKFADGGEPEVPEALKPSEDLPKADAQSIGDTVTPNLNPSGEPVALDKTTDFEKAMAVDPNNLMGTPSAVNPIDAANQVLPSARIPGSSTASLSDIQGANTVDKFGKNPIDINASYALGQKAIRENQGVEAALAKERAGVEKSDLEARAELMDGMKRNTEDFQAHQKALMQDYANGHINPNAYVQNMSTPGKISTAIGLFLGGLSTPFTHQGNPALEFLNKQIDRDIAAQRENIDKKKTLLGANQSLYHDQILADNATRINLNNIYEHQIQAAAAKLGTPQAKARADAASSQFAIQNHALLQKAALRATVLHAMRSGGQGLSAIDFANAEMLSPEQAQKEQASIDAQRKSIDSAVRLFKEMDKEQSAGNLLNPQSYARRDAQNAQLVQYVMDASPTKRLTRESAAQEIEPFMIKTTDSAETRRAKAQGLLNVIHTNADPTPHMSQYAPKSIPRYDVESYGFGKSQTSAPQGSTVKGADGRMYVRQGNYMVPVK